MSRATLLVGSDWHILDRWVQRGYLEQVNASSLDHARGDNVAQDLMDRALVAFMAVDAHDATHHVPRSILNEWAHAC
jgi:tyrosine-protein phosphatase YwqE